MQRPVPALCFVGADCSVLCGLCVVTHKRVVSCHVDLQSDKEVKALVMGSRLSP